MRIVRVRLDCEVEVELKLEVRLDSLQFVRLLVKTYLSHHEGTVRLFDFRCQHKVVVQLHSRAIGVVGDGQLVFLKVKAVVVEVLRLFQVVLVGWQLGKSARRKKQC